MLVGWLVNQSAAKACEHILCQTIGHSHFIFGYVVVYGETYRWLDFGPSAPTSDQWSKSYEHILDQTISHRDLIVGYVVAYGEAPR